MKFETGKTLESLYVQSYDISGTGVRKDYTVRKGFQLIFDQFIPGFQLIFAQFIPGFP